MKQKHSYDLTVEFDCSNKMTTAKGTSIHVISNEHMEMPTSSFFRTRFLKLDKSPKELVLLGISEIIGTAILMFLGCIGCVGTINNPSTVWQGSFTFGFAVFMAVQTVGHLSGAHINPCVTLSSIIMELTALPVAIVYIVCQIIGALLGFGMIHVVLPLKNIHGGDPNTTQNFCATLIHEDLSITQGLILEILSTALLLIMICAIWDKRNSSNTDSTPLKVGIAVFVLSVAVAPHTGCSMNPARSLAPAIFNNNWTSHWVYWVGPITGASIATTFYKLLYWPNNYIETAN